MTNQATIVSTLKDMQDVVANEMADGLRKAGTATDVVKAINDHMALVAKTATDRFNKGKAERDALQATRAKASEAFMAHVSGLLNKVWKDEQLNEGLAKLDGINRFTFSVAKGDDGTIGAPTLVLGGPKRITPSNGGTGDGNGGGRKNPLTVDGQTYESAAAAKVALLPDKVDASMSRSAVISAMKTAGKVVTE
jgi:hypothetical protein